MEAIRTFSSVFLDVDGTLLDSRHQVSANTAALLQKLERRGVPVILCSARPPKGIAKVAKQAGLQSVSVCYAGALTVLPDQTILESHGIEEKVAVHFEQAVREICPGVLLSAYLYDVWLTENPDAPAILREAKITGCRPIEGSLSKMISKMPPVHKLLCIGNAASLSRVQRQIGPLFPQLTMLRSNANYLEVVAKGVCKERAMKTLLQRYGFSAEQALAIGDGEVDIGMIRAAGLGVAMGNAAPAVQAAADYVTAANDEEGVYLALKRLHFAAPG